MFSWIADFQLDQLSLLYMYQWQIYRHYIILPLSWVAEIGLIWGCSVIDGIWLNSRELELSGATETKCVLSVYGKSYHHLGLKG